jgi:hypothetical protein
LRDAAQHYILEMSEQYLYFQAQTGLTLFRDIVKRVFNVDLKTELPVRVLPISTTPPMDIQAFFRTEVSDIKKCLHLKIEKAVQAAIQSEPVSELNEHIINHFFEHSGKKSIVQILEDNGITEKIVIKEAEEFIIPYLEKAAKDGFLKERIEARLEKFYNTL